MVVSFKRELKTFPFFAIMLHYPVGSRVSHQQGPLAEGGILDVIGGPYVALHCAL